MAIVSPGSTTVRLGRTDRYQPAVLVASMAVGLGLARALPDVAPQLLVVVPVGVFTLIYAVMLEVRLPGIGRAVAQLRFIGAALVVNFVVNPVLAWGLAMLFLPDQPDLATGTILFLVTPCIGWYLIFTELAGGDVTLGVALLAVNPRHPWRSR